MKHTDKTPGMFHYYTGGLRAVSIVLDHVTGSILDTNGNLFVHSLNERNAFCIPEKPDQEAFDLAMREHIGMKYTYVASVDSIVSPCCDIEAMLCGMERAGEVTPEPPKPSINHMHTLNLEGVDMTDAKAVMGATAAVANAIRALDAAAQQESEHVLPTRFMKMPILSDYCRPLRHAVDVGVKMASEGAPYPVIAPGREETVRDMLVALGWKLYQYDTLPKEPPVRVGDLGATYLPENKVILMGHLQWWNNSIAAGKLVAFSPNDRIVVLKEADSIVPNATYKALTQQLQQSNDQLFGVQNELKKYQRVVEGVRRAQSVLAEFVTPDDLDFSKAPAPAMASNARDVMTDKLDQVRQRFGLQAAQKIRDDIGKSGKIANIADDKVQAVLDACLSKLDTDEAI